jgi:hypothetical protein
MSALRKEEPSPATDVASQRRPSAGPATTGPVITDKTDGIDQAAVDPAARRPPQSVATPVTDDTSDRAIDDTYDGEIVSSTVNENDQTDQTPPRSPAQQPGVPRASQNPAPQTAAPRPQSSQPASSEAGPEDTHLFDEEELRDFRARWDQVQTSFVDEPRHAVEQADALVGTVVKRIADQFADERAKMEQQWGRGQNVSTEDLRQGFKRYRAFFDRLLSF